MAHQTVVVEFEHGSRKILIFSIVRGWGEIPASFSNSLFRADAIVKLIATLLIMETVSFYITRTFSKMPNSNNYKYLKYVLTNCSTFDLNFGVVNESIPRLNFD